jgi:hypothetical protein
MEEKGRFSKKYKRRLKRAGSNGEPAPTIYNIPIDASKKDLEAKENLVDYEPEEPISLSYGEELRLRRPGIGTPRPSIIYL